MAKRPKPRPGRVARKTRPVERRAASKEAARPAVPVVAWPPAPPPQAPRPAAEALALFEEGMAALHRHAYREAAGRFESILERFPAEGALRDRARVYLDLCQRELRKQPPDPRTIEERLTAATAALNDGDEARAGQLAESVLREDADQDLAHYLLAAVAARRGAADDALGHLAKSISLSPEASAQARFDADFESLRDHETFRKLTEPPASNTPAGSRRRRGRG
jgi:tetratricopeptide (TPR) repeat protein